MYVEFSLLKNFVKVILYILFYVFIKISFIKQSSFFTFINARDIKITKITDFNANSKSEIRLNLQNQTLSTNVTMRTSEKLIPYS